MTAQKTHVVVIGGGYAGALAAVRVAGRARRRAAVTLIEPRRDLVQRLRLHQLAAGQDVRSYGLDRLTGLRVRHVRAWAHQIDMDHGRVVVRGPEPGQVRFDYLIVASGSGVDTTTVPGVAEHAHSLAGPDHAVRLRESLGRLPAGVVVAVCGGGMTGLEAASEFAEARPDLDLKLITAGGLGDWLAPEGRRRLSLSLERLGVDVMARARVTEVGPGTVTLEDGPALCVGATVWCGGFRGQPLARDSALATDGRGRVLVDPTLRAPAHPNVLAAGDAAAIPELPNGAAVRMTCQAGMPAGAHAADSVVAILRGREPEPFDFGYIHQPISLGRRDGLIQWVDRADRPRDRVLSGRPAAIYKQLVTGGAVPSIRMERRLPGALKWPTGGRPAESMATSSPKGAT